MSLDATYTSTTTAFKLTATPASGTALPATDPSQYGNRPLAAFLQATVANIRFTTDGSTPTASHGSVLTVGNDPFLYAGTLVDLQFIRESAGAILNVVYGAVTDTVGPQGAPGTTGETGPTGATGAAGADGVVQSVVAGTNITVDNTDPANPVVSAGGGGGLAEWSAGSYATGTTVLNRGGTWKSTGLNATPTVAPISGNADWTLVGGTPYMTVEVDPPTYNAMDSAFITLIPATINATVLPVAYAAQASDGVRPTRAGVDAIFWDDGTGYHDTGSGQAFGESVWSNLNTGASMFQCISANPTEPTGTPDLFVGKPLVWGASDTVVGGSDVVTLTVFYNIVPASVAAQTYFIITAVVQGAKTFTVTDAGADLNGATGSIDVVGSTGNNDTYTIVSSVSGAGSTVITTTEAIPDATADGWVKQ